MKMFSAVWPVAQIAALVLLALGFPHRGFAAEDAPMAVRCAVTNQLSKETVVYLKVGQAVLKAREEGKWVVVFFTAERAFPEDQKSDSKSLGLDFIGRAAKDGFSDLMAAEPIYEAVRDAVVVYAPMGEKESLPDRALLRLQDACGLTDTYPSIAVLKVYPEATAEDVLAARKTSTGAWADPAAVAAEIRQLLDTPFPEESAETGEATPVPQMPPVPRPSSDQESATPLPAPTVAPEQTPAAMTPSVEPAVSPTPAPAPAGQLTLPLWAVVLGLIVIGLVGRLIWTIRAATAKTQPAAPVARSDAAAAFVEVLSPFSARHEMTRDILHLGRAKDNEVILDEKSVSKHHAVIQRKRHDDYAITDLDSGNGTLVNGKEVQSSPLSDGDVIELGEVKIRFWLPKRK